MLIQCTGALQGGELAETKGVLELFLGEQKRQGDVVLQQSLQGPVKAQDDELKRWFASKELGERTNHFNIAESTRPGVTMKSHSSSRLPPK